jgi:type II secretion system protein N
MGPMKTIFAYLLFALLAVCVFLYFLFPDETVRAYVDNRLAGIDPSLSITADAIRPTFPLAVSFSAVDLIRNGASVIHVDQARVSPALATLFKQQKRLDCMAKLAGGTVDGRLFIEGGGPSSRLRAEADLTAIRLERIEALSSLDRFTLTGPLNGRLTHDGARAPAGQANGLLTAPGLRITLNAPVFGIAELVMDQTEADFSLAGQTLRLKALTFNGPLVEGKISGRIEIEAPFGLSRLRLNGNLKPQPELFAQLQDTLPKGIINPRTLGTRGVNFRIYGTIDNPDVSMR